MTLEQEEQELRYYAPYNKKLLQISPYIDRTEIGYKRERNKALFHRLNELNKRMEYKTDIKYELWYEIKRYISILKLPLNYHHVRDHAFKFYEQIPFHTKYRNAEYIVPVIIYIECLENFVVLSHKSLVTILKYSSKDFNCLLKFYYSKNNDIYLKHRSNCFQIKWCCRLLSGIKSQFDLNDGFLSLANELLFSHFGALKNKKATVIASLITEAVKCIMYREDIIISQVCHFLGVVPSIVSNNRNLIKKLEEQRTLLQWWRQYNYLRKAKEVDINK